MAELTRHSPPPQDARRRRCKKSSCGWPSGSASGSTRATKAGGSPEDMHRARKTGKRTRYAAEVAPVGEIPDLVHHATALQDILGEYQDSVVATALLQRLAEDAPAEAASASASSSPENADWLRRPGSRPAPRIEHTSGTRRGRRPHASIPLARRPRARRISRSASRRARSCRLS